MQSRVFQKITNENGTSFAEVIIAIVIMTIVLIGGLQFVNVGRETITTERYYRLALMIAESRLEEARRFDYAILSDSLSENDSAINMDNVAGTRTTIVSNIDDDYDGTGAGDADADPIDYKKITVTVNWAQDNSVTLETYVSRYFYEVSD